MIKDSQGRVLIYWQKTSDIPILPNGEGAATVPTASVTFLGPKIPACRRLPRCQQQSVYLEVW
ncbi:hypothetical protein ACCAA_700023 [Candidatus Accumulibacter aalborgensis]|uniref:Uncharacterized protein n=1 Tax=Candidatus Accumulibacter aalborgensis TaxID=1860102 RepID=A0A1A8XWN4_9PROT|nr:hypothetical protein ACCAA_700023 [Candidatus Accumulibacter aalborgensis]